MSDFREHESHARSDFVGGPEVTRVSMTNMDRDGKEESGHRRICRETGSHVQLYNILKDMWQNEEPFLI